MLLLWSVQLPTLISESEIESWAVDKGLCFVIQFVWVKEQTWLKILKTTGEMQLKV